MPKLKQNNPPNGKPKNRTAAEAARLGISEDKLSELVKKGIIPVIKLGHSTHLFDPETTDAALLRHAAHNQKVGENREQQVNANDAAYRHKNLDSQFSDRLNGARKCEATEAERTDLLCTDGQDYPVSPEEMSRLIDREIGEVN